MRGDSAHWKSCRTSPAHFIQAARPRPRPEPASGERHDHKGGGDACAKDDPVRYVKRGRVGVLLRHEDEVVFGGREAGVQQDAQPEAAVVAFHNTVQKKASTHGTTKPAGP